MLGLRSFMPYVDTPLVLLALAGVLVVVGAPMGPETRHVDLVPPELGLVPGASALALREV